MASGWRRATLIGVLAGLFGPVCAFIWGLTKHYNGWIEDWMYWIYPFWWVMFGTDASQSERFVTVRLMISLSSNIIFFVCVALFIRWFYLRVMPKRSM